MKKKTLLLTLHLIFLLSVTYGQCNGNLSSKGYAHIKAAQTLTDMATTTSDWKDVAIEYEQVIVSDPEYAPVYMILGDLYTKIGNEEGVNAFNMAEYYYNGCKTACADSADAIEVKLTILNALRRKYDKGPNRFVGAWGREDSDKPIVNISYNGQKYLFERIEDGLDVIVFDEGDTYVTYGWVWPSRIKEKLKEKKVAYLIADIKEQLKADPGWPTSGEFKYNNEKILYLFSIVIQDNKVYRKYIGFHGEFFQDGQKVFSGYILLDKEDEDSFNNAGSYELYKK